MVAVVLVVIAVTVTGADIFVAVVVVHMIDMDWRIGSDASYLGWFRSSSSFCDFLVALAFPEMIVRMIMIMMIRWWGMLKFARAALFWNFCVSRVSIVAAVAAETVITSIIIVERIRL